MMGGKPIHAQNLHKIQIDTQTHLINFYYHLQLDLKNHTQLHKLEGLTIRKEN